MRRPVAVTTAAVVAFVFGAFGLCGLIATIPAFLFDPGQPVPPGQEITYRIFEDNPGYLLYTKAMVALATCVSIALIFVGVGLLKLSPWARKAMIGWAVYAFVAGIAGILVLLNVFLPMLEAASQGADPMLAKATKFTVWSSIVVSAATNLVVPMIVLGLLLRPASKEAFRTRGVTDPDADPVRYP